MKFWVAITHSVDLTLTEICLRLPPEYPSTRSQGGVLPVRLSLVLHAALIVIPAYLGGD